MQWLKRILFGLLTLGVLGLIFKDNVKEFALVSLTSYEEEYITKKIGTVIAPDLQFYNRAGAVVSAAELFQDPVWVMVFKPDAAGLDALHYAQAQQVTTINQQPLLFISFSDAMPAQLAGATALRSYVSHARQRDTAFSALLSPVFFRIEGGIITQVKLGYSIESFMEGHHFSLQ